MKSWWPTAPLFNSTVSLWALGSGVWSFDLATNTIGRLLLISPLLTDLFTSGGLINSLHNRQFHDYFKGLLPRWDIRSIGRLGSRSRIVCVTSWPGVLFQPWWFRSAGSLKKVPTCIPSAQQGHAFLGLPDSVPNRHIITAGWLGLERVFAITSLRHWTC